jgi:phenylacetic acid degradation operon negative regulatory protein
VRARSALFTLFGDAVRPAGGTAWLTTLTACMAALGFTPQATRTALHRMAADGWVTPTRTGRFSAYRLPDAGVERLEEAAARIYRLRAADWDGRWHLLLSAGAGRNAAVARELQWSGHGRLTADLWVSPHPQGRRLERLLEAHSLLDTALRFDTAHAGNHVEDERIVTTAFALDELRDAHAGFLAEWANAAAPTDEQEAFTTRIRLVHHWRSFLFLDPGLPAELLPSNWLGDEAAATFRTLYEALDDAAWRYYEGLAAAAPPLGNGTANGRVQTLRHVGNPFVHGIDTRQPRSKTRSTA